jgi:hypothetical protein
MDGDFTLNVVGKNVINNGTASSDVSAIIVKTGNITVTGTGSLDLDAYSYAIDVQAGSFTQTGADVDVYVKYRLGIQTSGSLNGGSAGFFHIGEMQLYSTKNYYIIKNAQAEADALIAAMAPLPSEATTEDYDALLAAYEAFMYKVFGIIPSGINETLGTSNEKSGNIYDLSGRKIQSSAQKGVYIVGGKKIVNY